MRLSIAEFRLVHIVRRNRERVAKVIPPRRRDDHGSEGKPEVVAQATVCVTDPIAFRLAIARGVGRHRAFGFGLIALRQAAARTEK
jgi:CRISPR system Cascade subunit CasE